MATIRKCKLCDEEVLSPRKYCLEHRIRVTAKSMKCCECGASSGRFLFCPECYEQTIIRHGERPEHQGEPVQGDLQEEPRYTGKRWF